jgi:hypothetical protein
MAKRGTLFEQAVADIIKGFGDVTDVAQGEWHTGPDGRRDRDVKFNIHLGDRTYRALIECKDYDRVKTGRVGIGVMDALDSKRRDLKIDVPMVCSNAGFTKPALAKAERVGIHCIGALRDGDDRIRFQVSDKIYTRRLTIDALEIEASLKGASVDLSKVPLEPLTYMGDPVCNWLLSRIHRAVGQNPIVKGRFRGSQRFRMPLTFASTSGFVTLDSIGVIHNLSGAWYEHEVQLTATSGLYDWARRRVRPACASGFGGVQNLNLSAGKWVKRPPQYVVQRLPLLPGEIDWEALEMRSPLYLPPGRIPALDGLLVPDDVDVTLDPSPPPAEAVASTRNYKHPPPIGVPGLVQMRLA